MKKVLISVHVPKTGGTSFRRVLEATHGKRLLIDQPWARNRPQWMTDGIDRMSAADIRDALARVGCIHGHFNVSKYLCLRDIKGIDPVYITWLRDPVERVLSAYYFLRNMETPKEPERQSEWERKAKDLDIEEYLATTTHWRNMQAWQLRGLDIDGFAFVGVVEMFDDSMAHFEQIILPRIQSPAARFVARFMRPIKAIAHERKNPDRNGASYVVPPHVREIIETGCAQDFTLYRRAVERVTRSSPVYSRASLSTGSRHSIAKIPA